MRFEIPWVDRLPAEIIRDQVRLTVQPCDAPTEAVERILDHLRSDEMLLWASDWPHWQFDGDAAMPPGIPAPLCPKLHARERARRPIDRLRRRSAGMNVIQPIQRARQAGRRHPRPDRRAISIRAPKAIIEFKPFMSERWWQHLQT